MSQLSPGRDTESLARRSKTELADFQHALHSCFQQLSTLLPEVHATAEGLAGSVHGDPKAPLQESLESVRSSMHELHVQVGRAAEGIARHNTAIGAEGTKIIDCMRGIVACLNEVGRQGTRLRYTALNATIAAERAGAGAQAFGALTRTLSEVTNACIAEAKRAADMANDTGDEVQRLDILHVAVAQELAATVETCELSLSEVESETIHRFERLLTDTKALGACASAILSPIRATVIGLQQEDILRQGLDHAILLLSRASETKSDGLELLALRDCVAFEVRAFEISHQIVTDVASQVEGHLSVLLRQTHELEASTAALARTSAETHVVTDAELTKLFLPLRATLEALTRSLGRLGEYRRTGATGRSLLDSVRSSHAKFAELTRQLGVLKVVILMEGGRVPSLTRAIDIASEVKEAQLSFVAVTDRLLLRTEELGARIASLEATLSHLHQCSSELDEVSSQMQLHVALSRDTGESLSQSIQKVTREGSGLSTPLRAVHNHLEGLQKNLASLAGVGARWLGFESELRSSLARLSAQCGVASDATVSNATLRGLVEQFTIASHKHLASELGSVAGADLGDSGGEFTLF